MRQLTTIILALLTTTTYAAPVLQPGDIGLRHDTQLLADYGVISGPVSTWPLSWDAIAADLRFFLADVDDVTASPEPIPGGYSTHSWFAGAQARTVIREISAY